MHTGSLVSTAVVRSAVFLKVRRTYMGKKTVCKSRKKESATTGLYNSINSSAAKVKADLMFLAC